MSCWFAPEQNAAVAVLEVELVVFDCDVVGQDHTLFTQVQFGSGLFTGQVFVAPIACSFAEQGVD